jgi:hypothetical protein
MAHIAAHSAVPWRIERRMADADAPPYAPSFGCMRRSMRHHPATRLQANELP